MKYLKRINEANDDDEKYFIDAINKGYSSPINGLGNKYNLYDDYYYYDEKILKLTERESGGWYAYTLEVMKIHPMEFKDEIFNRIDKLQLAFSKIN